MYNDEYWLDGRYNNQNFKVAEGVIYASHSNPIFTAYSISPPTQTHSLSFCGTQQHIWYQFPDYKDYNIYIFDQDKETFTLYKEISGDDIYEAN